MEMKEMTYKDAIRLGMSEEMRRDKNVIFFGEDIGLYGGAFGLSVGMLDEFGEDRVKDTPISEAVIAGAAAGAAATGLRPICEMMFMDFVTIAMDNLANQAAKMRYMFGGKAKVPMVMRLPAGSGTGAAAQHTQSLEAWLCHVPGLKVVTPSTPAQAKGLIKAAIRDDNPVCFIEHKLLYKEKGDVPIDEDYIVPLGVSDIKKEGTDVTIISYGTILQKVMIAAQDVEKEGISVEVVDPITLYPMDIETIIKSVKKTGRAIVVHEAAKTGGLGGEIAASITESEAFDYLDAPVLRLAGLDVPIPYNRNLEAAVVPGVDEIKNAIYKVMNR
ncbi:alpha-ketoacid dehydrogenase subunit beta [Alkalibaculum sp. M08DMB]|uniref:Alpha-ketoacid dehydrogenase subunit beta n=2 Tax=Alkalibaculum sporogenes TaxID=2655001 RepID=A0A6A7KCV7_9FIRM|nr:alpha-ketoacid dehydrogenase subunit beta [Alkalibaculum sporogenes]MPW27284.1 alpha-ketoacid dehydrogenase subunit beta [Alkalibaculum sporogenes]